MLKALFLIVFVPLHSIATFWLVSRFFSSPATGLPDTILRVAGLIFSMPLLYPLICFDPDGGRIPRWLQWLSWPLNSLIWGLVLLAVAAMARWLWEKLQEGD
jgi:hypothetical protein